MKRLAPTPIRLSGDEFTLDELDFFINSFPYLDYRRHRSVDHLADKRILHSTILKSREEALHTSTTRRAGNLTGIAILSRLDWDSEFFGRAMTSLQLFVSGESRQETATVLLKNILQAQYSLDHITLRLDAEDICVRFAAEELGFRTMDTLLTYEHVPSRNDLPQEPGQRFQIRRYQSTDRQEVLDIANQCFSGYGSRFFNDPLFGPDEAKRLYLAWTEKCCSGEMAENLLLAEHRGRTVGFLGWRLHADLLEHASLKLHGAGLGGCLKIRCNAYIELLWHAVNRLEGEPADFESHLFNIATINAYQDLGFRYVKSRHNLHFSR